MENAYIFRILILCVAALAVTAEPSIQLEATKTQINPGETFQFNCVARNLVGGTSFLRIQKTVKGTNSPVEPLILSTNAIKTPNLEALSRYTVTFEAVPNAEDLRFVFIITDAEPVDSGEYGCLIMGGNGVIVEDKKEITVVDAVNFILEMTVTRADGETATYSSLDDEVQEYELEETETFNVVIHTSQTNPAPQLNILVGDQNIKDQFVQDVSSTDFKDSTGLLTGVKYEITATGNPMIDFSYSDGFKVVGTVDGQEQSMSFKVNFLGYPPVIDETCTHSIMAGNHQKNVLFQCTVISDEPVEVYFYYIAKVGEEKKIITPGSNDDYHYKASMKIDGENDYNVTLHMPHMYPQMFNEYTLVASNSKGSIEHMFMLELDSSKSVEKISQASHLSVTVATILMLAIAAIFSQQL